MVYISTSLGLGVFRGIGGAFFQTLPYASGDVFPVTLQRDSSQYRILESGSNFFSDYTGSTIYISPSGNDTTGDGTSGNPYQSINKAVTEAVNNDIISMEEGIYATPTNTISKDVAFIAPAGNVYIGRFNDLSTAQVDASGTLWNVDDVNTGETFIGYIRTDGVYPQQVRGSAFAVTNDIALDYQTDGIMSVFAGGTSANFSTGSSDTLPDLIVGGHILAWTDADTQEIVIGSNTQVYFGSGITMASYGTTVLRAVTSVEDSAGNVVIVLDGCEVYGGSDSTIEHSNSGNLMLFDTIVCGGFNDNIDYRNDCVGVEKNVISHWSGSDLSDNVSTTHDNAKVLRVGGSYKGGSRTIHDVNNTINYVFSCSIGDARFGEKVFLRQGFPTINNETVKLYYGDITFTNEFGITGTTNTIFDSEATVTNIELTDPWLQVPQLISGLQLWLDASDTTTITENAGAVSQWDDKSGNDNHATQATGARQPTTGTQTLNGLNIIDFNADFMSTSTYTARTFFFVTNNANGSVGMDNSENICPLISENITGQYIFLRTNSIDYTISLDGAVEDVGTAYVDTGANATGGNIDLSLSNLQKSEERIWVVTGDQNYTGTSNIAHLETSTIDYYSKIEIAEILAYTGVLTTSQINQVGNYLASKWGITWTDL